MDLCYSVESTRPSLPVLPTVSLMFSGAEMSVSGIEAFVIGHHHQQNVWMEFDLVRSRVGFAEVRCDQASQKLGLTP
ncbi:hypothetical protein LWI28_027120 [Acer negundo]|uniref:Xylanase inhibitor C-terminal domain-containing protein n=1 Tax=Acer negundo TaxID=4023 RepID=A0AAD5IBV2_ACENE|nr:hypothetical protein LWI28_027120 [Acer negundo]